MAAVQSLVDFAEARLETAGGLQAAYNDRLSDMAAATQCVPT